MLTALFWVITQKVVVIYYRRFGTTYQSLLQGSWVQKKPAVPVRSLYEEECGRWKVLIAWCQPIGLKQLVGREGSVVVSAAVIEEILTGVIARYTGFVMDSWPLKKGPIFCPEKTVRNYDYHYWLRNNTEHRSSQLNCSFFQTKTCCGCWLSWF
jgi:hypothetical protein